MIQWNISRLLYTDLEKANYEEFHVHRFGESIIMKSFIGAKRVISILVNLRSLRFKLLK